jgi:hypothetical protein
VASGGDSDSESGTSPGSSAAAHPNSLAALRRYLLRSLGCTVVGLLLLTNPPPIGPAALAGLMGGVALLAGAGLWYSLRARRYCRQLHLPTLNPWLTLMVSLVTLVLAVSSLVALLGVPTYRDYTECLQAANTHTAHERCTTDLRNFLRDRSLKATP